MKIICLHLGHNHFMYAKLPCELDLTIIKYEVDIVFQLVEVLCISLGNK